MSLTNFWDGAILAVWLVVMLEVLGRIIKIRPRVRLITLTIFSAIVLLLDYFLGLQLD